MHGNQERAAERGTADAGSGSDRRWTRDVAEALTNMVAQRALRLPPRETRKVTVRRDVPVSMRDGTVLLGDHWAPRQHGGALPTLLIRSPYGRAGAAGALFARLFAERGFQVFIQSVRGTFGSDGEFRVAFDERADGLDTIGWIVDQPWFDGSLALTGPSYLGYTQWAVADAAPAQVKAMVPQLTSPRLLSWFIRPGTLSLDVLLRWTRMVSVQQDRRRLWLELATGGGRRLRRALRDWPPTDVAHVVAGRAWTFGRDVLAHLQNDSYWSEGDHSARVGEVSVPVSVVAGWYDLFTPESIRDYRRLRAAGRSPRLTVGPWEHASPGALSEGIRETLGWARAHCLGLTPAQRAPVRVFVLGSGQWKQLADWPPPGYTPTPRFLHPDGLLGVEPAPESEPDRYRYDPADPTPAVGGPSLLGKARANQRAREARSDVLTYTTPELEDDLEIIGDVSAEIWLRSSRPHSCLFVRLCDVDTRGRSHNICDGITAISTDTTQPVRVELWPTAYRFRRGHRIRVQISSGAHPLYARHPGSDQPISTQLHPDDREIFHDISRRSAVYLPQPTRVGPDGRMQPLGDVPP